MDSPPAPGSPGRPPFDSYRLPLPRRRLGPGGAASLLLHGLLVALIFWRGAELVSGGGGDGPLGGGGGARPAPRFVSLPSLPAPAAVAVPLVVPPAVVTVMPTPDVVPTEPEPIEVPRPAAPEAAVAADGGAGAGTGGGQGTGAGTGIGAQTGPGTGGEAGYIFPADPRGVMLPPPGTPASVKGRRHAVTFWVEADGRISRVEISPEVRDARYRREWLERMRQYRFRPARTRDGRPVASILVVDIIP